MWALPTPSASASRQAWTFGNIPSVIVPFFTMRCTSLRETVDRWRPFASRMPLISVIMTSFSARKAAGNRAGHEIRIDVIRIAFAIRPDGRDYGDVMIILQITQELGSTFSMSPTNPKSPSLVFAVQIALEAFRPGLRRQRLAEHQSAVFAAQTDRLPAMSIQQIGDFHVDLAGQHHLHDFHRGFIGDPDPWRNLASMPSRSSILSIWGPPP